jgi:hypothetical protein
MSTRRPSPKQRILAAFRRVRDVFPFTGAGLLIAAASGLAFFDYGLERIDLILLGVGAVGLGIAGLSLVFTALAALLTWRAVRRLDERDPVRLECGYWAETGFSLPSLWYLPFVAVSWKWREPQARVRVKRKRGRALEEVFPERRGLTNVIDRRFDVGDIFGVCKISFSASQTAPVRCMPWVGALRQMHIVKGMAGGDAISHPEGPADGDRYDMRHYNAGDPIRFVLWKVFAKSRELIVRTPERAISPSRKTAVYMVANEGDEPAAGAARTAIDVGAFGGDWVLGADGSAEVTKSPDQALELLARSAHTEPEQSGAGLAAFLKEAAPGALARAVVFVPPTPGPWLDRVAQTVAGQARGTSRISFVVGVDGIDRASAESRLARLMRDAPVTAHREHESPLTIATWSDLTQVVRKLGHDVLIVDRLRGQMFTPAQLRLV